MLAYLLAANNLKYINTIVFYNIKLIYGLFIVWTFTQLFLEAFLLPSISDDWPPHSTYASAYPLY